MEIKIGPIGRIVMGDELGSYVKVLDDSENTGGYLILISAHQDMSDGGDNWVEDQDMLERYFSESQWVIDWLNESE